MYKREQSDGEIAITLPPLAMKRCKLSGGEDHLSALPDDLLINILLKLRATPAAARTSVLSRRWRRIWTLLPELHFLSPVDPHCVRPALLANEAPVLRHLSVRRMDGSSDSLAAWLPLAARRLSGDLTFINMDCTDNSETEPWERCAFELPCFENATSISLDLEPIGIGITPTGVFARLTYFFLAGVQLHGPCKLGDALSSPRCPSLRRLTVLNSWGEGIADFAIHSESLLRMELKNMDGLQQLTVTAPALKLLSVTSCFRDGSNQNQPVANIFAPQLVCLDWRDAYDPTTVQLGEIAHLQWLRTCGFFTYGDDTSMQRNSYCTGLLERFELINTLHFTLFYLPNFNNCQYLMEDITRLPSITVMTLNIMPSGHSFGAGLFHVLRMCTGVRKLTFDFFSTAPRSLEAQILCPPGCICGERPNWKTDELVLDCLQVVEINYLKGTEHEAALLKRLFDWATKLKEMTVNFSPSVTESKAKEFSQTLLSFSRSGICLKGPHFAPK